MNAMNIKRLAGTGALAALLALQACTSTFVASKDGKGYHVGNSSGAAYRMFCESGDLQRILAATTTLVQGQKDDLYASNCGQERSNDRVRNIYSSMTAEQRRDLRQAFKKNGYDINAMRC
jgi:hypothetical protein